MFDCLKHTSKLNLGRIGGLVGLLWLMSSGGTGEAGMGVRAIWGG